MQQKFLIFTTRQLCYNSAHYFAWRMQQELQRLGYECELCELPEDGIGTNYYTNAYDSEHADDLAISPEAERILEQFLEQEYMGVIDFNSKLPRLILDDNSYYLDHIHAPFYNYILDHPLYHHSTLDCKLQDYHVLLVDNNHASYVKTYYPHVKEAVCLPLGADEAEAVPFDAKEECVLFMGTYRDCNIYREQIATRSKEHACIMEETIAHMQNNPFLPMEVALQEVLSANKMPMAKEQKFALLMNYSYPVELYLRNAYRERTITQLLRAGLPVRIVGDWWEHYRYADCPQLTLQKPVAFADSYAEIAKCAVLLNSSPFFQAGIHDRVFAGMANHTAVLTDTNSYIVSCLGDDFCVQTYRLDDDTDCARKAEALLEHAKKRRDMVQNGYERYQKQFTWECHAKKFLQLWNNAHR